MSRKIFAYIFKKIGPTIRSKNIIDKNLKKFSFNISETEKNIIKNNMWSNYGMTFIEYIYLNTFRKTDLHVNIEGEEVLDEINIKNKTVIFVSGHFANFELMSMEITKKNINLATIYRPLNNIFLNPFMEYLRKKYVCKNQIKKGRAGVKEAIAFIDKQHSIALMIDQRVSEGELVNLFNQPSLTTTLPAQLALKYNLKLVPVYIERKKDNSFNLKFHSPIQSQKFKDKLELTKYLNIQLESMLLKNPGQWIWTHNKWKI